MQPQAVHYIPLLTTVLAFGFGAVVFRRWRSRGGLHLCWWAIGLLTYGIGTLTESLTTVLGWHPAVFKAWYISGALLGGAPLAQGTVYLLLRKPVADRLTVALLAAIGVASLAVLASPINWAAIEGVRLSGRALEWQWVRMFSPFINLYAAIFLIGGAVWSAVRYWGVPDGRDRAWGNVLIAAGALLPGIGGSFTRFGHVEVLYVTEFAGLWLILAGYWLNTRAGSASIHPVAHPVGGG